MTYFKFCCEKQKSRKSHEFNIKVNVDLDSKKINKRQNRAKNYDASRVLAKRWVYLFRITQSVQISESNEEDLRFLSVLSKLIGKKYIYLAQFS